MPPTWKAVIVLLASVSIARADSKAPAPPAPDLVVTWQEGERSKDMSIWTTTIEVTGTKLHVARTYAGRNGGRPGTKPVEVEGTVKDPRKLAAALAALDKIKVRPPKQLTDPQQMRLREGCITRGKATRCASAMGSEPDPEELKAIAAVRDALLDGVQLPP
ncbi:MAG: hypothetical protein ABI867_15495 [Kofleriaceae bacterium]